MVEEGNCHTGSFRVGSKATDRVMGRWHHQNIRDPSGIEELGEVVQINLEGLG